MSTSDAHSVTESIRKGFAFTITTDNASDVCKSLGLSEPLVMEDAPDMVFESKI